MRQLEQLRGLLLDLEVVTPALWSQALDGKPPATLDELLQALGQLPAWWETERPEGLESGTLELVGHDRGRIVAAATRLLTEPAAYERMAKSNNPYGDGHASERMVRLVTETAWRTG